MSPEEISKFRKIKISKEIHARKKGRGGKPYLRGGSNPTASVTSEDERELKISRDDTSSSCAFIFLGAKQYLKYGRGIRPTTLGNPFLFGLCLHFPRETKTKANGLKIGEGVRID